MTSFGIGLIGVGKHGSRYARHLREDIPGLRLVALARRDRDLARQQAAELKCRAYSDYRELIAAPEVEAVVVVVPPTLHAEIIAAAAEHRRPVLLEKPAAPSVADGRRMLHTARAAGIPVMVAQTLRYNGVVRALMAARERIGPVHALRICQRFEPSRPGWIDDPKIAGGGIMLHTGVHSFDLMRLLSEREAERVSCEIACVKTLRTEDNFSAVIRLRGGTTVACVSGSRATASRSGPIEMAGERGQLIGDHVLNTAHFVQGSSISPLLLPPTVQTVREVLQDFGKALRAGTPMPITLEEGLRAVAIAEACYQAAATARAIPVPTIDE